MTASHVVIGAVEHVLRTATASLTTGGDIITDTRYDGMARVIDEDGAEVRSERCQHHRAGYGGGQVHPHKRQTRRSAAHARSPGRSLPASRSEVTKHDYMTTGGGYAAGRAAAHDPAQALYTHTGR